MEKVSIIIPAYNASKTIEKCLHSIINQTYKDIEIIVVNDGSDDDTEEVVNRICKNDPRIVLINQVNQGVSSARNQGINTSNGIYIMFVDCDDWLEENMVEVMVNTLEEKNVDVVRCNFFDDYSNYTKIGEMYDLSNKTILKKDFDKYNVQRHFLMAKEPIKNLVMLLLIKKDIIINNEIYFDKNLFMLEDVYFYQKLFSVINSVYFLDRPLYHYYENDNSVTHSSEKYEKMICGVILTNEIINKFFSENNILNNEEIKLLNGNHVRIIILYLFYIWNEKGNKELINVLNNLYSKEEFISLLYNSNDSHVSYMFRLFFKSLIKKRKFLLCFLFLLKKIKGGK